MANVGRIPGCKGRFVLWGVDAEFTDPELIVADLTSFSVDESSEIREFTVLDDCGTQTGESTISYTLSIEGIYGTEAVGQPEVTIGGLRKWRFYPIAGDDATVYMQGEIRWNARTFSAQPEEQQSFTASAVGNGLITRANMH